MKKHFDAGSRLLRPLNLIDHYFYGNSLETRVILLNFARWAYAMKWSVPEPLDLTPKPAITAPTPVATPESQITTSPAPAPPAAPVVADSAPGGVDTDQSRAMIEEAPASESPKRRLTWWIVASAYMVDVMRAGQYAKAKELFNELEKTAGPDTPFDKGTGNQRGNLFVREIAKPLTLKTLQNNWLKLKEIAQE